MGERTNVNEEILEAWLRLSTTICNDKVVSDMPYNEALVCNILYRNHTQNPDRRLTATELCSQTRILKSQMNRILNSLEEKHMIVRERSTTDKRQIFVTLAFSRLEIYERQHEKVLTLIDTLLDKAGRERADEIIRLFSLIAEIAEEVME